MPPLRHAALAVVWGLVSWTDTSARADEFVQDFRTDLQEDYVRFTGWGAGDVSRRTPRGLLFSIPGGRKATLLPVGVFMRRKITGDFEATVEYELKAAKPDAGGGAGVALWAYPEGKTGKVGVARSEHPSRGSLLTAYYALVGTDPNQGTTEYYSAKSNQGGLRLARAGTTMRFLVSQGNGPYRELHSVDFGNMPLREIGVFADTGGAHTELSVLLKSLKIGGPELVIDEDYAAPETKPSVAGMVAVLSVGVVPILIVVLSRMRARFAMAKR
jgi:hypothetical protein